MAWLIFLALIGVPIAEIAVFIELGGLIGLWPTLTLIIVTALLGTVLLRHQGLRTLRKAQESLARSEVPVKEAMDGIMLLVAGAFLLTPGFITDAVGALLLCPPVRTCLRGWITSHFVAHGTWSTGDSPSSAADPHVIEGEFVDLSKDERRPSPWGQKRP
jgi:UPF0716 protein FxsA